MLFTVLIIMAYILQIDISVGQFEPGGLALFAVGLGNFAMKVYQNDRDAVSSFYRKKKEIYLIQYVFWAMLLLIIVQIVYSFSHVTDYSMLLGLAGIIMIVLAEYGNIKIDRKDMAIVVMMNILLSLLIVLERLLNTGVCELLKLGYYRPETAGATLLPGSIVAIYMYITESYAPRERLYMCASILSLVALVLNGHMISIGLMLIGVLMYPLVLIPTARVIEKSATVLAIYMVAVSNACIVFLMMPEAGKAAYISIDASIYLDVLVAIGIICYYRISAIIPQNADRSRIFVHRLEKMWTAISVVLPMLLLICSNVGSRLSTEEGSFLNKSLAEYGILAVESRQASQPWIYSLLVNTNGAAAIIVMGALIALGMAIGYWLHNHNIRYYPMKGLCLIAAVISAMSVFCMDSNIPVIAIYVYTSIYILYGNEKEIKYERGKWNRNKSHEKNN